MVRELTTKRFWRVCQARGVFELQVRIILKNRL